MIRDKRFFFSAMLVLLVVFWGCSSFFSFSWKTKKEVEDETHLKPEVHKNEAASSHLEKRKSVPCCSNLYGVQITQLSQKTPDSLERFMGRLRKSGVDTVFFRVFQNRGDAHFSILPRHAGEGVYFKTSYAPLVSDLLPLICNIAHRNGLKVYAWMNTLNAGFLRCGKAGHILMYSLREGRLVYSDRLSPYDPEVKRCLTRLFSDLAKNPIDGILVQDDLILHYNEDFSPAATRLFREEMHMGDFSPEDLYKTGESGSGKIVLNGYSNLFWTWCRWKSRKMSEFMGGILRAVRETRPSIKVAVDINYEALLFPDHALAWYSRSIQSMERYAHPDYYVVMSYQRQMQKELGKPESVILGYLREMVKAGVSLIPDPGRWVFKVQTIDWQSRKQIGLSQIRWAMESIKSAAPVHTCLMPCTPFLLKNGLLARLNMHED